LLKGVETGDSRIVYIDVVVQKLISQRKPKTRRPNSGKFIKVSTVNLIHQPNQTMAANRQIMSVLALITRKYHTGAICKYSNTPPYDHS